jgi:hypothetical protein
MANSNDAMALYLMVLTNRNIDEALCFFFFFFAFTLVLTVAVCKGVAAVLNAVFSFPCT